MLQIRPRSSSLPSRASQGASASAIRQPKTPQPAPRTKATTQHKTSTPNSKTALKSFATKYDRKFIYQFLWKNSLSINVHSVFTWFNHSCDKCSKVIFDEPLKKTHTGLNHLNIALCYLYYWSFHHQFSGAQLKFKTFAIYWKKSKWYIFKYVSVLGCEHGYRHKWTPGKGRPQGILYF